ncbi:hypothetical protein ABZ885_23865, partial [Kitasatospora sp. NPDC047058]
PAPAARGRVPLHRPPRRLRQLAGRRPTAAPVSGQEFLGLLTGLLPAGRVVDVGEARGTESGTPQLRLTHDDGHGTVQYLFWITRDAGGADEGCAHTAAPDVCTESTTADGSRVVVYQAGTRDGEPAGAKTWSASLITKSGYHLMLQEWNRRPLEQGTDITRAEPPLTAGRMVEVVTDKRWDRVAAAIPADGRPGAGGAPGVAVTPGGKPLLPSDVVSGQGGAGQGKGGTPPLPQPGATGSTGAPVPPTAVPGVLAPQNGPATPPALP